MRKSPSHLDEDARRRIVDALNATLADGIDLQLLAKVAHWNLRGPRFLGLHVLFDGIADGISIHNDVLAERAITLGGRASGTARHVGRFTRLPEYPADLERDVDHVAAVGDRVALYLQGARSTRSIVEEFGDGDTADALTQAIREVEKQAWMLGASLGA